MILVQMININAKNNNSITVMICPVDLVFKILLHLFFSDQLNILPWKPFVISNLVNVLILILKRKHEKKLLFSLFIFIA